MSNEYYQAARNMKHGGSFAASIAEAFFNADSNNQKILTTAFKVLFNRYESIREYTDYVQYIIDHINASSPCSYSSIKHFCDDQLPDHVDTGEILQMLIDDNAIHYCHESQSYSVNN